MNKKIYIGLGVFLGILAIIVSAVVFVNQKNKYQTQTQGINDQISTANSQSDTLIDDKDTNEFLPTDVVKYFVNELRNDSKDKAKLYVVNAKRDQDFAKWLNVASLTDLNTVEVTYNVSGTVATVDFSGYVKEETNSILKIFELVKEDNAWRINDIKEN